MLTIHDFVLLRKTIAQIPDKSKDMESVLKKLDMLRLSALGEKTPHILWQNVASSGYPADDEPCLVFYLSEVNPTGEMCFAYFDEKIQNFFEINDDPETKALPVSFWASINLPDSQ